MQIKPFVYVIKETVAFVRLLHAQNVKETDGEVFVGSRTVIYLYELGARDEFDFFFCRGEVELFEEDAERDGCGG